MSPSWRKQLGVAICGDRVGIVVFARGWRRAPEQTVVLEVRSSEQPGFFTALARFDEWLVHEDLRGAALHLTLSDDFVRYALMPASPELNRKTEREQLARACLESLYGSHIAACDIGYDDVLRDQTALSCAIEREHLQAVRELCGMRGLRLHSLKPGFVRAVNRWRGHIPPKAMLLMPAVNSIVGAAVDEQKWISVWQQPLAGPLGAAELESAIRRESLLRGQGEEEAVVLLRDGLGAVSLTLSNSIVLPQSGNPDAPYPIALAALPFA